MDNTDIPIVLAAHTALLAALATVAGHGLTGFFRHMERPGGLPPPDGLAIMFMVSASVGGPFSLVFGWSAFIAWQSIGNAASADMALHVSIGFAAMLALPGTIMAALLDGCARRRWSKAEARRNANIDL